MMMTGQENQLQRTEAAPLWLVVTSVVAVPFIILILVAGLLQYQLEPDTKSSHLITGISLFSIELQCLVVCFYWRRFRHIALTSFSAIIIGFCLWLCILCVVLDAILFNDIFRQFLQLFIFPILLLLSMLSTVAFGYSIIPQKTTKGRLSVAFVVPLASILLLITIFFFGQRMVEQVKPTLNLKKIIGINLVR